MSIHFIGQGEQSIVFEYQGRLLKFTKLYSQPLNIEYPFYREFRMCDNFTDILRNAPRTEIERLRQMLAAYSAQFGMRSVLECVPSKDYQQIIEFKPKCGHNIRLQSGSMSSDESMFVMHQKKYE